MQISENKIDFSINCQKTVEKLPWLTKEILRIFRQNNDILKFVIKASDMEVAEKRRIAEKPHITIVLLLYKLDLQTSPILLM